MIITVFTPTYNRAHLLPRLYESLVKQTCRNFEWIIVDDGSSDNTAAVVNEWCADFPIRFFRKENGGKHTAINLGVEKADGELFFIADSDDLLPPRSLELVSEQWQQVKHDGSFGGVCGLDQLKEGDVIGGIPSYDVLDCTFLEYLWKYKMQSADMKEVYRTSVLREFPFPEIIGEKFCPEDLVWSRIAQKYKLRYFSQVIYIADYQENGISANIIRMRMNSPLLAMLMYAECISYKILPILRKVRYAINYWRFRACYHRTSLNNSIQLPTLMWFWNWTLPLGYAMHLMDLKLVGKQ